MRKAAMAGSGGPGGLHTCRLSVDLGAARGAVARVAPGGISCTTGAALGVSCCELSEAAASQDTCVVRRQHACDRSLTARGIVKCVYMYRRRAWQSQA